LIPVCANHKCKIGATNRAGGTRSSMLAAVAYRKKAQKRSYW
jgi:hypothetical protein